MISFFFVFAEGLSINSSLVWCHERTLIFQCSSAHWQRRSAIFLRFHNRLHLFFWYLNDQARFLVNFTHLVTICLSNTNVVLTISSFISFRLLMVKCLLLLFRFRSLSHLLLDDAGYIMVTEIVVSTLVHWLMFLYRTECDQCQLR